MKTTITIWIDVDDMVQDISETREAMVRIDRISGTMPAKCTKNDRGVIMIEGQNLPVRKGFNNVFRAFCEYNRLRSIAPFN